MDATHGGAAAANNSSNSAENSNDIPHLRHLQSQEVLSVRRMFAFYDTHNQGKISAKTAFKLFRQMGLGVRYESLPAAMSLRDVLVMIDSKTPPSMTAEENIDIACRLISGDTRGRGGPITPASIIDFMTLMEAEVPLPNEVSVAIERMLEPDECEGAVEMPVPQFKAHMLSEYRKMTADARQEER